MAATNDDEQQPLHILFFPFVAPGHLIPAGDMAALFASRGVKCTILTTPANAAFIRSAVDRANDALSVIRSSSNSSNTPPPIDIATVPFPDVGLPPGVENVMGLSSEADILKLLEATQQLREPFDRFLAAQQQHGPAIVDAVVADSFFTWAANAAARHGVPRLSFLGSSMVARACTDALVRHNPLERGSPVDDGLEEQEGNPDNGPDAVVALPGLPHRIALRRSQLMDPRKNPVEWAHYDQVNEADRRSFGEVFNSFADLEPDYVDHYRKTLGRRVWLVGPLAHAAVSNKGDELSPDGERCLRWLDGKPNGSVVYVCFGTLSHFSVAERRELARGLQLSGKNFVWVMSSGEEDNDDEWMPQGFAELLLIAQGQRQRRGGLIFRGWAPQKHILNHPAVDCFVTHCGWNSVLEAISAGVPMVTWPQHSDQFYNEKLVVELLKVGVSLGATVYGSKLVVRHHLISGETIAGAIGGILGDDEEAEAIRNKAKELGVKAKQATDKGGSSYEDVGRLIRELMARRRSAALQVV